jgi:hypothetical protein
MRFARFQVAARLVNTNERRRERSRARSQGVLFYHTRDVVLSRARFCISAAPRNLGLGAVFRIAIISSRMPRLPFSATYASPIAHPLLEPPSPSPSPPSSHSPPTCFGWTETCHPPPPPLLLLLLLPCYRLLQLPLGERTEVFSVKVCESI